MKSGRIYLRVGDSWVRLRAQSPRTISNDSLTGKRTPIRHQLRSLVGFGPMTAGNPGSSQVVDRKRVVKIANFPWLAISLSQIANSPSCGRPFSVLKNKVSHCTLDLISWKILLKTCCLKCLIRYDTIRWRAEFSDFRRIRPYLDMDPVVKLLTNYNRLTWSKQKMKLFCCFSNLFENSLNVQCIHDITHLVWILMRIQNMKKYGVSMAADWSRLARHQE